MSDAATPHWLRVVLRTAVFAVAFEGDTIIEHAPYAGPILRGIGSRDVHKFMRAIRRRSGRVGLLRGDGPCVLDAPAA